jgi:transposase-like protein
MMIREAVKAVAAELMELEVSDLIGAERGKRRPADRVTHRNGYRARRWDTRAGEIELQIPKIRQGSYSASFLEPRRCSEQALLRVVQQAYLCSVSTCRVDQFVEAWAEDRGQPPVRGAPRARGGIRTQPLEAAYPYVFLDARSRRSATAGASSPGAGDRAWGVRERAPRDPLD